MKPAVSITGLVKQYGPVKALRGLDLSIAQGQIYGLLGPNGSGKTTLIKTMVGAVKPTAGTVMVLGQSMPHQARSARKQLGYMPQVPALYSDLSVRANIRFFARAHKPDPLEKGIDQTLEFVGLRDLAERKVATLSGGLKQRCSLACALVHQPALLLLDEPTAGVDPVLKESFWRHFRSLANQGVTIIIATHLMDEPLTCDRVGILREGSLLIEDTPENILARGKTRVTLTRNGRSITTEVTDYTRELPALLTAYGLQPDLSDIAIRQEGLEDIFLKLIQEEQADDDS